MPEIVSDEKRCTACGKSFPATGTFFARDKSRVDRLFPQCKVCKKEYDKLHYSQPHVQERLRAQTKARYYLPGVHEQRIYQTTLYRNRPEVQENIRTWRNFPEVHKRKLIHNATRRAQKKAIQGTYTPQQIEDLLKRQKYRCYYCSHIFEKCTSKYLYHIDHTFPLSRVIGTDIPANDISYLVLACPSCNVKKHNRFPWEFFEGGRLL